MGDRLSLEDIGALSPPRGSAATEMGALPGPPRWKGLAETRLGRRGRLPTSFL